MGVVGIDCCACNTSSGMAASPPSASSNSDCFVFLLPSFIPEPLNAGTRVAVVVVDGDDVRTGAGDGAS